MNTNIPKIIHGIWFGPEMPSEFRRFYEGWKQLHPDWQIKLWSLEDVQRLPLICTLPFRYIRDLFNLQNPNFKTSKFKNPQRGRPLPQGGIYKLML